MNAKSYLLTGCLVLFSALVCSGQAPPNDNFTNAIAITGLTNTVTGSNVGATRESGEPLGGGKSVWWNWTAPTSGGVTITTAGSDFPTLLGVYTGNSVTNFNFFFPWVWIEQDPKSVFTSRAIFLSKAVAGTTYHIAVDGANGATGNIVLTFEMPPPPINDDFTNRIQITGTSNTVTGSNIGATYEDEVFYVGPQSVWWTWTAPTNGQVTLSPNGSDFGANVGVFTGEPEFNLVLTAGNRADLYGQVRFQAVAGTTYQIGVGGYPGTSGNITLSLTMPPAPANGDFANRIALTGSDITVFGSNVGASQSVWWSWTAPRNGSTIITTAGSDFNTFLSVHTGTSVSNLTFITSNDDASRGVDTSLATFQAVAGMTYQIAVSGYFGAAGNITLHVLMPPPPTGDNFVPAPANDNFANRIAISSANASVVGSNVGASKESGEPDHAGNPGGKSVWWSWTAPTNGTAMITTAGSDFTALLAIYTGVSVPGLMVVTNNYDANLGVTNRVMFQTVAGTSYQIAIDGLSGAAGNIKLAVAIPFPPANDNFAAATVLTGSSIVFSGSTDGATSEAGEPSEPCGDPSGPSVWYSWTAPESTWLTIETIDVSSSSGFEPSSVGLMVYAGTNIASLAPITYCSALRDNLYGRYLSFAVTNGTTYYLQASQYYFVPFPVSFRFRLLATNAPVILEQPTSYAVSPGEGVVFKVLVARSYDPFLFQFQFLTYQWRFNDFTVQESSMPMLAMFVTSTNQAGRYSVVVSDQYGAVTSAVATLTVNVAPVAPSLTALRPAAAGQFDFMLAGETGRGYFMASSTDLINWFDENIFRQRRTFPTGLNNLVFNSNGVSLLSFPQNSTRKFFRVHRPVASRNNLTERCINQLRQIEFARDLWAIENRKRAGDTPTSAELFGASLYLRDQPTCPLDGSIYALQSVGILQTCVNGSCCGHVLTEPQY